MSHYYNNPEADANTLVDGWIRTGDVGYFTTDNKIKVQDRLIDMIKIGEKKVSNIE